MEKTAEKRAFERFEDQAEIIYGVLDSGSFSNAKMFDCSMGGMFFMSKYAMEPGTPISIRINHLCSIFDARVIRCMEMPTEPTPKFGIGIQYMEPVSE